MACRKRDDTETLCKAGRGGGQFEPMVNACTRGLSEDDEACTRVAQVLPNCTPPPRTYALPFRRGSSLQAPKALPPLTGRVGRPRACGRDVTWFSFNETALF